jgi:hypothetical protein
MGMIIQASHMNLGYMQQLKAQQRQGAALSSAESALLDGAGARLASGLTVANGAGVSSAASASSAASSASGLAAGITTASSASSVQAGSLSASQTLGQTVANEIVRRMDPVQDDNGETQDVTGLRDSLASTLDWVRERFGDETGAAASGMVMVATADSVTEETLGQGLLDVLSLIDQTQGIASGDEAIARFNSGINTQLNSYFDNGQSELFYAVESGSTDAADSAGDVSARLFMRTAQANTASADAGDLTQQLLESMKQELEDTAGLQDLTTQLEEAFDPTQAMNRAMTETALNAYAGTPVAAASRLMDMAV